MTKPMKPKRGAPEVPPERQRRAPITTWTTDAGKALIVAAAARAGIPVARWSSLRLEAAARAELGTHDARA
jgi:hypothetical protein